jgi:hypothetical protein
MLFPSLSYEVTPKRVAGEPGSLAREMPGWLYLFRVIPGPTTWRATRDSLKTKVLVGFFFDGEEAAFFAFSRQILQIFTGN